MRALRRLEHVVRPGYSFRSLSASSQSAGSGSGTNRMMLYAGGSIAALIGTAATVVYMNRQIQHDKAVVKALPILPGNPVVYLDIEDNEIPMGRITIHLRKDKAPLAAENFRMLCTGELGYGYRQSPIYGMEKHARLFGGDFYGNGTGGCSIYGDTFPDECLDLGHVGPGTVAMRNYGPNTNNSQFYITLRKLPQYDGVAQVVGYVTDGFEVLEHLDRIVRTNGRFPKGHDIRIATCGEVKTHTNDNPSQQANLA